MLVELGLVEQRLKAVHEVLDGATVVDVADRYGVVRQTVHTWLKNYATSGMAGLVDKTSKPASCPHQMPATVEARIVELRRDGVELSDPTIAQTLRIEGEMVWANDGCNSWNGSALWDASELTFAGNGTSTAMLCINGQETTDAFNEAVRRTTRWAIAADGVLVLTGPGSHVELIPQK